MADEGKDILTGKRILVIEDEPTIRRFYERLFETYGLDTTFAPTGDAAMTILESGQDFEVILLDIRLPGVSGRTLWKLLQIKRPELRQRVIMVTGDILSENTQDLVREAGRPYLEKPFATDDLLEMIAAVIQSGGERPEGNNKCAGE